MFNNSEIDSDEESAACMLIDPAETSTQSIQIQQNAHGYRVFLHSFRLKLPARFKIESSLKQMSDEGTANGVLIQR